MRRLTIAFLLLLAFPASAAAVFPGENGPIVFTAGNTIGRVEADGAGLAPVTNPDEDVTDHDWVTASADGQSLAFQFSFDVEEGEVSPPPALGSMPLDAKPAFAAENHTPLQVIEPHFLPNGRVVYVAGGQLRTAGIDGGLAVTESAFPADRLPRNPIPSPDGDTVYYRASLTYQVSNNTVTDHSIRSFRFSDNQDTEVTPWVRNQEISPLDVSPDGDKLLYQVGKVEPDNETEVMLERDLSAGTTRTARNAPVTSASYSPDGEFIAYAVQDADQSIWQIRVKNAGDLGGDQLVPTPGFANNNATYIEWALPSSGITVTETDDGADTDDEDGVCDGSDDAGTQCTLRAAIETINAEGEAGTIEFDVGDGGPQTLTVDSELPALTEKVTLDGTTQPSFDTEPLIAVQGGDYRGLRLDGAESEVKGLIVHGFTGPGIVLAGADSVAEGNWVGFKREGDGYVAAGNGAGIDVRAAEVRVGGPTAAQRNVIAGNGNPATGKAYVEGLNGNESAASIHDGLVALGSGVVVSDDDATGVTITGNAIGSDPTGGSFGEDGALTSTVGVAIAPDGILEGVTVSDNDLKGNLIGVLALAPVNNALDDVQIRDNELTGFGLFGITLIGQLTNGVVDGNTVQNQVIGIMAGAGAGVRITDNDVGKDENIEALVAALEDEDEPALGGHNLFGLLIGADNATIGGPGAGNRIYGNLINVFLAGNGNALSGNKIGLSGLHGRPAKVGDLGSIIGVLLAGADSDIGDPGAGNTFNANAVASILVGTTRGHFQANEVNASAIGMIGVQTTDLRIEAGNAFTNNVFPAMLLNWAPTPAELDKAGLDAQKLRVRDQDRRLAFTAPASQGPLALADATTPAAVEETAVALGDPPSGAPARGAARRRASSGTVIKDNRFGSNVVGPWLIGSHSNTVIEDNEIAHNDGGGLWLGFPASFGSAVAQADNVVLRSNRIFDNYRVGFNIPGVDALGFDLLEPKPVEVSTQAFGVTANDPLDADAGPNGLQNHPDVLSVQSFKGSVVAGGSLGSKPSTKYTIELFANARCSAYGSGEGQTPLGTVDVTTDGAGNATFLLPITLPAGQETVTATATGPEGTSEFSPCQTVVAVDPAPSPTASPSATPTPPDTNDPDGAASSNKPKAGDPITVTVTSDEDGTVTASGSVTASSASNRAFAAAKRVKVKLTRKRTAIKAGQTKKLKLKPKGKKAIRKLKRAVRRGAKATATVNVVFTDLAGNRTTKRLKVRLRKP